MVKPKWIWYGVSGLVFIIGLVLLFVGLSEMGQAWASKSWQPVDGVIVSSKLVTSSDQDGATFYGSDIRYSYDLAGQSYSGNRVYFGALDTTNRQPVFDLLIKYEQGDQVTVFYDPGDPAQAVLEPGLHPANWFFPALGTGFALFGSFLIAVGALVKFDRSPAPSKGT